jgi:hypothetical protein
MISSFFDQVQNLVGSVNAWLTQALHGNSIVAGAVTASLAASVFFLLRKTPLQLWNRIKRYVIFTYEIEYRVENYGSTMIQDIASKFEYELQRRVSSRRPSARLITRKKRIVETLSDGGFFYRYNRAWMYVSRRQEKGDPKAAATTTPAEIRITLSLTALRFNRSKIIDILSESAREYMVPGIYQVHGPSWGGGSPSANRTRNFTSIPILAIDAEVKGRVDAAIDNFLKHRAENNAADRPHKLVFMFYGEPGTGKSALAEYIAYRLRTSLFCINALSTDRAPLNLGGVVECARDNVADAEVPVILVDDFDTFWNGLRKRAPKRRGDDESVDPIESPPEDSAALGRLLVSLQSPTEINDCVVIFTTNHLEKIDQALYRPGRVNVLLEVGRMKPLSIAEYFEKSYILPWPEKMIIERSLRACDVSSIFSNNEDDPEGFIRAVTSTTEAADEIFNSKAVETIS